MPAIRKILNPVDFSEASTTATHKAVELARALGAELVMLHVIDDPAFSYADGAGYLTPALAEEYETEMRRRLNTVAAATEQPGLKVTPRLVHGKSDRIAEVAEEEKADLIILGTHGRSGLARMLLGSVAERVLRTSKVPVLTIRNHG